MDFRVFVSFGALMVSWQTGSTKTPKMLELPHLHPAQPHEPETPMPQHLKYMKLPAREPWVVSKVPIFFEK